MLGQRRRRLAAADPLDRAGELAQRPREIAREQERRDEQRAGDDGAPQRRARRAIFGRRRRQERKADPVAGIGGLDADEQQSAPRRRTHFGARAQLSRSRSSSSCSRRRRRRVGAEQRTLALGDDPHAVLAARSAASRRGARFGSSDASAARTAFNCTILVSSTWRESSATRSWRKRRIVAASAIETTASNSSASRPNRLRGEQRHVGVPSGASAAASSSGTNT